MTVTGEARHADAAPVARPTRPARGIRHYWPNRTTWPLWVCTAGMPFAWMLGLHGIAWCMPGLVFGARILSDKNTRFPKTTIPLVGFLTWILLSATVLTSGNGVTLYVYRWSLFAGALTTLVWLVNVPEDKVSSDQIVDWLAMLWIVLVGFGFLGIAFPSFAHISLFQMVTGPIGRIGFVDEISNYRLAETQGFLGYALPRPAAPFGGTNGWGAAMGILTPFFLRSWIVEASGRRRRWGIAIGLIGVYPILISVNRGLWISLTAGLVYYACRKAMRGKLTAVYVLFGVLAVVAVALVATPAGTLVQERLNSSGTERSNESRADLYHLAYQGAQESPLIGNGTPQRAVDNPTLPPVGTHGLIWYLMYVHGFVGLGLFLSWFGVEVLHSGRIRRSKTWWTHLSLIIALVEVPFYGLLPQVVLFGVAAGLAHREEAA